MKNIISKLVKGNNLTSEEMTYAIESIMSGTVSDILIAGFLTALRMKGETVEEITAGAKVMRNKAEFINLDDLETLDTCGTGGDSSNTYNISTAVALICAASGIYVVKHGNRSVSSKSGSADFLETAGININLTPSNVEKCVRNIKIGFLFAPIFHKSMKYAAPVRRELGIRTIFNILGPLSNPAKPKFQMLGVFNENLTEPLAEVLKNLGLKHAMVVYGMDGLDEISISDRTKVSELKDGKIVNYFITPEQFGINKTLKSNLVGGDSKENINIINRIFEGEKGPKRDILVLNAGAAIYTADKVSSINEGIKIAEEMIDSGKAKEKFKEFIEYTKNF